MSLSSWLRNCSALLRSGRSHRASRNASWRRSHAARLVRTRRTHQFSELLEDRVLPASFSWVGDVNTTWSTSINGDTNWSDDGLPANGDSLSFTAATGTLSNDLDAGSSFSMTFVSGDYTITGESITLDGLEVDIHQIAGENLLQTPLQLDATEINVESGVLTIDSAVSGTGGLTKLGDGVLVFSGPATWTGATEVEGGTLRLDSLLSATDLLSVSTDAVLGGSGGTAGPISIAGELAPQSDADGFSAASVEFIEGSRFAVSLGGSQPGQFGRLNLTGTATLAGTLAVEFVDDFQPAPGDTFEVLVAAEVSGRFTDWSGLDYGTGALLPVQTPTALYLIATPHAPAGVQLEAGAAVNLAELTDFFNATSATATFSGSLLFLNQQLSGSFTLTRVTLADNVTTVVSLETADATLAFSGDSGPLLSLADGAGTLLLAREGLFGVLAVTLSESLADIDLTGTFSLQLNSSTSASPGILDLPAGPFVRMTADDAVLETAAGRVTGAITVEASSTAGSVVQFAAGEVRVLYGDAADTTTETDDWGALIESAVLAGLIAPDGTVALSATGDVSMLNAADLLLSGTAAALVNTTTADWQDEELQVGGQTLAAHRPRRRGRVWSCPGRRTHCGSGWIPRDFRHLLAAP